MSTGSEIFVGDYPAGLLIAASLGALLTLFWSLIYNAYFHPLSSVPGPIIFAVSEIPGALVAVMGRTATHTKTLHDRYGPVVRIAPNRLSFIEAGVWKTVYGRYGFPKDYDSFDQDEGLMHTLFTTDEKSHQRLRKAIAPAFSMSAIQAQEPVVIDHADSLIRQITARRTSQSSIDMAEQFNWLAVDIASDLSFSNSLLCLSSPKHRPWLDLLGTAWKVIVLAKCFKDVFRPAKFLGKLSSPFQKHFAEHFDNFTGLKKRISDRIDGKCDTFRKDFVSHFLAHADEGQMSREDVINHASLMVAAGTETVATLLPAVIYFLCANPQYMNLATAEVRAAFQRNEDINFVGVARLSYLSAVLDETHRLFPAVPEGLARSPPREGAVVGGYFVPEKCTIQISAYAANRSSENFLLPESFLPERWLGDQRFSADQKDVVKPFSYGPRNCLGRDLAMLETKIILAKLLWSFDMSYKGKGTWTDQKSYLLWVRKPLPIHFTVPPPKKTIDHQQSEEGVTRGERLA